MKKCKNCETDITDNTSYCPKCGAKNKKPIWKRVWVWILVVIVLFVFIGSDNEEMSNDTNSTETNVVVNDIGGYTCEIVSAETGYANYENKPTIIITYQYTNNSDTAQSFDIAFIHTVFQNGIECSPDYLYSALEEENSIKEIRPGSTITVKKSYILNDTTSDIEVEVSGFMTWDDNKITKTFTLTQ